MGRRFPLAVEVDVETPVGAVVVRSRIDAVFAEPDGGVVVVDWKTGRPPSDPVAVHARELQLAVYRLAWSRRSGMPLDRVSAAFFYVASGETVRPSRSLDPDRIERTLAEAVGQDGLRRRVLRDVRIQDPIPQGRRRRDVRRVLRVGLPSGACSGPARSPARVRGW